MKVQPGIKADKAALVAHGQAQQIAVGTLLAPGAQSQLPAAQGAGTRRMLYFFVGEGLCIEAHDVPVHAALELVAGQDWPLTNTGSTAIECLLLQGQPIGEPVAQ